MPELQIQEELMKVWSKESRMKVGSVGEQRRDMGNIGLTEGGMMEKEEEHEGAGT